MKTPKFNALKTTSQVSLSLLLLLQVACGQTSKKQETNVTSSHTTTVVAPAMDIQAAILSDQLAVVEKHIKAGTDLNKKDAMSGATPLITAASFGKLKITKALIDAGVDLNLKNNDGATALHTAAFFGRIEIVQLLIDAKADTTIKNNFGANPRESVLAPFNDMKPVYEMLQQQLAPMGMQIDLKEIEKARPVIAMMLQ